MIHSTQNIQSITKIKKIIKSNTCVNCGACIALDENNESRMVDTEWGPIPELAVNSKLPPNIESYCPAYGINYPYLYKKHFNRYPENWLVGNFERIGIGYSCNTFIRNNSASGGILSEALIFLLEQHYIDGAIVAKQGIPTADKARAIIARTTQEIIESAQSVYIPVSMLDILSKLNLNETYAITTLPEQTSALRKLQIEGNKFAKTIKYVLGPYTGTALYPSAIKYFLKSRRIKKNDEIKSLKWRAGEWPGYLEIITNSGITIKSPKVYYNFLIPFFITRASLQSMDFTNEFTDLSVGDAWSPKYEKQGKGFSVVLCRSKEMSNIVEEMVKRKIIIFNEINLKEAIDMHGHMIDFKKRGGYLRNQLRKRFGKVVPDYGFKPCNIPFPRKLVEVIIISVFGIASTKLARWILTLIPEKIIGPVFNFLRLGWKDVSKPTKRKSLFEYKVLIK